MEIPDQVFRQLVDRTAVPFVLMEADGTVRYASRSLERYLGWAPEDVAGRNVLDYLDEEHVPLAATGLTEIQTEADASAAIPVVLPIRRKDGTYGWFEVAVMPLLGGPSPGPGLISLRLRPWDADHHLGQFMEELLADAPLDELLARLARSVAASAHGVAAAVHHGWDGEAFVGVRGSWGGADDLSRTEGPWVAALQHDGVLVVPGGPVAAWHWLVRVDGAGLPPAVLSVWTDSTRTPMLGHRTVLGAASRYVALALVRTAEHERLQHLAGHDALTGVANRATFRDRLARAIAIGESGLAVAFCDLDGFKQLNDRHGHPAGDDVLVEVARRLRAALRDSDELARMGGDEFTILCRGIADRHEAEQVAARLLDAIRDPFAVPAGQATLGISVGIALAGGGASADELLAAADAALYDCKRAGGRRWAIA